jgi:ABC-type lipoprotein release transport system permease subunit
MISSPFVINENWKEYSTLIEAVAVEKKSISLVLQIIVVVSIFNILAFVLFLMEKKSQDFFLLRSLGVSKKQLSKFWFLTFSLIWIFGSLTALALTSLFDFIIQNVSFFQLPGDIYVLSKLSLMLDLSDYTIVFLSSLVWVMLIGFFMVRKINKKVILVGLRQEFK